MDPAAFSSKLKLPRIGFGTADLTGSVEDVVMTAIKTGYRLIDTAFVYGSEAGVGAAVKNALRQGLITRDELFIETKLKPEKHGYYEALAGAEESLNRLQMDYLDMYMIHWPVPRGQEEVYREKNIEVWQAFTELKKSGKVRHIGVCNFLERHLLQLTENGMECPEVNQLEIHPGFQQRGLVRFCRERNIVVEAWSPMGRGILNVPRYEEMASAYGKDVGQLALRWSIQNGFVPLSRSSNSGHIARNFDVFDFEISPADMGRLNELNTSDDHQDIWSYKRQQMY